jgi:hypothetical protein
VIFAQHPAPAGQSVLMKLAGLLMLTQRPQPDSEVVGRGQRVGMILAQHPAAPTQSVITEPAGLLMLPERAQVNGDAVGRAQGVGMVMT